MEPHLFLVISLILLVGAIIASFTPIVPAGLLSISGVLLYWWSTGYSDPGSLALTLLILTGLIALFFDWFAGIVGAKAGGAKNKTAIIATLVGFFLLFVLGPLGLLIGIPATVFVLQYRENQDMEQSKKAAIYTTAAILSSALIQSLLTLLVLLVFLALILI